MKNFNQIKSGVIVEVQDYLYNVSIGGAFPYIKVPSAHPADKYYKDMDVVLGFINRDAPVIISRGFRLGKGRIKELIPMIYYLGNWGQTGWVQETSKSNVPSGNGVVFYEFPHFAVETIDPGNKIADYRTLFPEEPGFFDRIYMYGNKKVYTFPEMVLINDFSGDTDICMEQWKTLSYQNAYFSIIGVFNNGIRQVMKSEPSNVILQKHDLINTSFEQEINPNAYTGINCNESCRASVEYFAGDISKRSAGCWDDLGVLNCIDGYIRCETDLTCSNTCMQVNLDGNRTIDWRESTTYYLGTPGSDLYKQYWATGIGNPTQIWEKKTIGGVTAYEWGSYFYANIFPYFGNQIIYNTKRPLHSANVFFTDARPPTSSTYIPAGSGFLSIPNPARSFFILSNSKYRFGFDIADSDFSTGKFIYRVVDWKFEYINEDKCKTEITLPFTSNNLWLKSGIHTNESSAYNYQNFLMTDDGIVFFIYEDLDNKKIGVLGIDIIENEIHYHYQRDFYTHGGFEYTPTVNKLWLYGKYIAFNVGDKWVIIQ